MGRRSYRKPKASPIPMASLSPPSPGESPTSIVFNAGSSSKPKAKGLHIRPGTGGAAPAFVASPPGKALASVADLRGLASSSLDDLKRHLDHSHSAILKEFEASHSRLQKRFKMQTQSCQQLMDKVDEEYGKISEQITETENTMKETYTEFIEEVQASASRLSKSTIPDLLKSFDKALDDLRNRSGIASA